MASAESLKILRALQSKPENKVRLRMWCCGLPRMGWRYVYWVDILIERVFNFKYIKRNLSQVAS